MKITYKSAGVDIDKANALVGDYRRFAGATKMPGVLTGIGSFGSLFKADFKKFRDPVLVSSTDGVGTKLKLAILAGRHDTIGIDLVAMSTNDILCSGAKGLFFLDYISTGRIEPAVLRALVKGIARGCREAGYALVGGETAEMPGLYKKGDYDLAGFGVGVVGKKDVIDGRAIKKGDALLGISSSGLHSNGYSLVRKVFPPKELKRRAKELLAPTALYSKPVLKLISRVKVRGLANITGGAFYDKIPRIIPKGLAVVIDRYSWRVPGIFYEIMERGRITDREMYRTFNMGIGMVAVVSGRDAGPSVALLAKEGLKACVIGEVIEGGREPVII